ncbi:MAG: hypothetical protein ACPHRO_11835, partial [Nannocystaceae bacterium]
MTPPATHRGGGAGSSALPVVLVGHGATASTLLAAARGICSQGFENVYAVDAGSGDCEALGERMRAVFGSMDAHAEVLIMV